VPLCAGLALLSGLAASQARSFQLGGRDTVVSYGIDLRRDDIAEVGLYDTFRRVRLDTVRSDGVKLDALGLWSQAEVQLDARWRAVGGLRWDRRHADVVSSVAANSAWLNDTDSC